MSALKSMYYLGGFSLAAYVLWKVTVRDPEEFRKLLPEKNEVDYENASKKRSAAFVEILKHSAAGDSPEEAVKKLKRDLEKTAKTS